MDSLVKKYSSDLPIKLKQAFYDENLIQRQNEFKNLLKLMDEIANRIIEEPELQEVFDILFLKKIVKITSEQLQI